MPRGAEGGHSAASAAAAEQDDGPTAWCRLPLSYPRYVRSMGPAATNPRQYSHTRPHVGEPLSEKYHTAAVMAAATVKRPCICTPSMLRAVVHPWTGKRCNKDECICCPLLNDEGPYHLSAVARPSGHAHTASASVAAVLLVCLIPWVCLR